MFRSIIHLLKGHLAPPEPMPLRTPVYILRKEGDDFFASKQYGRALQAYKECLEWAQNIPNFAKSALLRISINYAHCMQPLGRHDEALQEYENCLRLVEEVPNFKQSNLVDLLINRAISKVYLQRYEEALREFDDGLSLAEEIPGYENPNFYSIFTHRAKCNQELGYYEEALRDSEEGLRLMESTPDNLMIRIAVLEERAYCYQALERYKGVMQSYEEALLLMRDLDAYSLFTSSFAGVVSDFSQLSNVYEQLGRYEDAVFVLKRYLQCIQSYESRDYRHALITLMRLQKLLQRPNRDIQATYQWLERRTIAFTQRDPSFLEDIWRFSLKLVQIGESEKGLKLLTEVLKTHQPTDPGRIVVLESINRWHEHNGNHYEIIAFAERVYSGELDESLNHHPDDEKKELLSSIKSTHIKSLIHLGRNDEAKVLAEQEVESQSEDESYLVCFKYIRYTRAIWLLLRILTNLGEEKAADKLLVDEIKGARTEGKKDRHKKMLLYGVKASHLKSRERQESRESMGWRLSLDAAYVQLFKHQREAHDFSPQDDLMSLSLQLEQSVSSIHEKDKNLTQRTIFGFLKCGQFCDVEIHCQGDDEQKEEAYQEHDQQMLASW